MTPYDVAEWAEFANTVAGGAAALAGLMFVGLSLNLTEVLSFPGVAAVAMGFASATGNAWVLLVEIKRYRGLWASRRLTSTTVKAIPATPTSARRVRPVRSPRFRVR